MSIEVLKDNVIALKKQLRRLKYSFNKCEKIGVKKEYSDGEFDDIEVLSSRFARSIDFLIRKVFRSIDDVEFENQGTLIDVVNNAHKRGLFETEEDIRVIKNIRNDIAHEYIDEGLKDIFSDILEWSPKLILIIEKTISYSEKYWLTGFIGGKIKLSKILAHRIKRWQRLFSRIIKNYSKLIAMRKVSTTGTKKPMLLISFCKMKVSSNTLLT